MTPETRERFAVLVERRLAGLLSGPETEELSRLLESSPEARELYFRAVEFHLDLGNAPELPAIEKSPATSRTPSRPVWIRPAAVPIAAGLLLGAGLIGFWLGRRTPDEAAERYPRAVPGIASPGQERHGIDIPPPPPPPAPTYASELRRSLHANVWLINMTGIVSECLRHGNRTDERARLQAEMALLHDKIQEQLKELGGLGEKVSVETYLLPGDLFVGFANRDFTTMTPGEAGSILREWVSEGRGHPLLVPIVLMRNDKRMTIHAAFPVMTKELQALLRHPGLRPEENPGAGGIVALPVTLRMDVDSRLKILPPGYLNFLSGSERRRIDDLLQNRKGSPEDVEWLRSRVLGEIFPGLDRDAAMVHSKMMQSESKIPEHAAPDVIYRKNGTRFEGQIIEETAEHVKVKHRLGSVSIPSQDIQRIERGRGVSQEFWPKYAEAVKGATPRERLEKLEALLAWCIEKNLKTQRDYVACVILTLDASHEKARKAADLPPPSLSAPK